MTADQDAAAAHAAEAVLGAILLAPHSLTDLLDVLDASSFYDQRHAAIWRAFEAIHERSGDLDVVTVEAALADAGELGRAGGDEYLLTLATETPTTSNVKRYAAIVAANARRRRLVALGAEVQQDATRTADVDASLAKAEAALLGLTDTRGSTAAPIREHLAAMLDHLAGGETRGVSTGLVDLDDLLRGLHPGNFILVGARPAMGKTALAVGIAGHVALVERKPVLFASLEMAPLEVACRFVAHDARVDLQRTMLGQINDNEVARFGAAVERIGAADLWIDDNPRLTVGTLAARAKQMIGRHGELGLIVVDYLQLMSGRSNAENRQVEVSEISRALKVLARELEVPVLAMAQLNRLIEQRTDKRPQLADLRESGSLEQDADVVLFLHRAEVYDESDPGLAEVIVAKHRNGPTGTVRCVWLSHCARFVDGAPRSA